MRKKTILIVIVILLISSLTFTLVFNENINKEEISKKSSNKTSVNDLEKKEEDNVVEKETYGNTDIVGNIKIEGTDIDEYIVQTTDNDYYLKHNI